MLDSRAVIKDIIGLCLVILNSPLYLSRPWGSNVEILRLFCDAGSRPLSNVQLRNEIHSAGCMNVAERKLQQFSSNLLKTW